MTIAAHVFIEVFNYLGPIAVVTMMVFCQFCKHVTQLNVIKFYIFHNQTSILNNVALLVDGCVFRLFVFEHNLQLMLSIIVQHAVRYMLRTCNVINVNDQLGIQPKFKSQLGISVGCVNVETYGYVFHGVSKLQLLSQFDQQKNQLFGL